MSGLFPSWVTESPNWSSDVIFLLDHELRFVDCNPGWDTFAAQNGGRGIFREDVLGKSILDFVPDVLRDFYVHKYWFAKRSQGWTEHDYHCSSPEKIRLFRMGITPVGTELLVMNHLLLEEDCIVRPPLQEADTPKYISPGGLATQCSNCRKTKRQDDPASWDWVPELLQHPELKISHGLCPRCVTALYS
jgi:hypothetical protein